MPVIGKIRPIFTVFGFDWPSTRPGKPATPASAAAPRSTSRRLARNSRWFAMLSPPEVFIPFYTGLPVFLSRHLGQPTVVSWPHDHDEETARAARAPAAVDG